MSPPWCEHRTALGWRACALSAKTTRRTRNSAANCICKPLEHCFGRCDGALFNSLLGNCQLRIVPGLGQPSTVGNFHARSMLRQSSGLDILPRLVPVSCVSSGHRYCRDHWALSQKAPSFPRSRQLRLRVRWLVPQQFAAQVRHAARVVLCILVRSFPFCIPLEPTCLIIDMRYVVRHLALDERGLAA